MPVTVRCTGMGEEPDQQAMNVPNVGAVKQQRSG
jgi:hypothetical protein